MFKPLGNLKFDGHRPRVGADIPEQLAFDGPQQREGAGTLLSFGDQAIMFEALVW